MLINKLCKKTGKSLIIWKITFIVPALVFFANFFLECNVEQVAILFANAKGETTLIFISRLCAATGNSQRDVSPALFCAGVAVPSTGLFIRCLCS